MVKKYNSNFWPLAYWPRKLSFASFSVIRGPSSTEPILPPSKVQEGKSTSGCWQEHTDSSPVLYSVLLWWLLNTLTTLSPYEGTQYYLGKLCLLLCLTFCLPNKKRWRKLTIQMRNFLAHFRDTGLLDPLGGYRTTNLHLRIRIWK